MPQNQKSESYQPRSVIWRESNYEVHLGQVLGVLDFDNNFDNQFQKWKLVMQFITDVTEAIKQEIIPLKKAEREDLMPNKEAISKMDKIWNENTYLGVVKNHDNTQILLRELFYDQPDEVFELKDENGKLLDEYVREIIPLPKLKNMIPIGEISDTNFWGIQIRESMALKYAFQGANYATIINDGKFVHNLSDGLIPKFENYEMKSVIKRTYILHRPVYNAIMDILPKYFNQNYFIFAGNIQKIMKWMQDEDIDLSDIIDGGNVRNVEVRDESKSRTENN